MNNTMNISKPGLSLSRLMARLKDKKFVEMAMKAFKALSSLFAVVVVVQALELHGTLTLSFVLTCAVYAQMFAYANKAETHLLKLRIEQLISGNEIPVFDSIESKRTE